MNRRSFLGMVAAVAAAAVGIVKRPKVQESNLYGSRMIDGPSRGAWSRMVAHDYAYNHPPHGMDYKIDPPRGVVVDRLPDDIVTGDVLYVRGGQVFRMMPRGLNHNVLG